MTPTERQVTVLRTGPGCLQAGERQDTNCYYMGPGSGCQPLSPLA